jgi:hypothetical protein
MTMNKHTPKLTIEEKRALKEKHRIENVMQGMGERFERDPKHADIWRASTSPGLTVNIRRQSFEISTPGMESQSGDVITWLMQRRGWTFPQAIRFLIHRTPDPKQEALPKSDTPAVIQRIVRRYESEYRDEEKEKSGLYEFGVIWRDGKTLYSYLPKPQDHWQERALEIGGEKMRDYFGWEASLLYQVKQMQYHRFTPVQDTWINYCDECDEEIDWFWKKKPQFERVPIPSVNPSWRRVRLYPEPQVFAYLVNDDDDELVICEDCKRNYENYYAALDLLYSSAEKREAPERERQSQAEREAARAQAEAEEREWQREQDRLNYEASL